MKSPLKVYEQGQIESAIWENLRNAEDLNSTFKSVSIKKTWQKRGTSKWKSVQINLLKSELDSLLIVVQSAKEELERMENEIEKKVS